MNEKVELPKGSAYGPWKDACTGTLIDALNLIDWQEGDLTTTLLLQFGYNCKINLN